MKLTVAFPSTHTSHQHPLTFIVLRSEKGLEEGTVAALLSPSLLRHSFQSTWLVGMEVM